MDKWIPVFYPLFNDSNSDFLVKVEYEKKFIGEHGIKPDFADNYFR